MAFQFTQTGQELQEIADLAQDNIALPYDTATSYAVGDYAVHGGGLYRCTAATSGAWTASKWTEIRVMDRIKTAESSITQNASDISALNTTIGFYTESSGSSSVTVESNASTWTQAATLTLDAGTYVVVGGCIWDQNNTGGRSLVILSNTASPPSHPSRYMTLLPAYGATSMTTARILQLPSRSTVYLYARQNSGSPLIAYPRLAAVRIR